MPDVQASSPDPSRPDGLNRRDFLSYFSGIGLSGTLLPGVLWARYQEEQEISPEVLADAE